MPPEDEIGAPAFADARATQRARAAEARRQAREAAMAALDQARAAFVEQAEASYERGSAAAGADCDALEDVAWRLVLFFQDLEPDFERLDIAREMDAASGWRRRRLRRPWQAGELAERAAEAMGEAALSGPAGAVLLAAVRRRAVD